MSNLSLRGAFKEDKFNLKTIVVMMILLDIFLFPYISLKTMLFLLLYEVTILISLLYGLRGQGKYKAMMINLQSIARNKDMDINERDSRLVSMIHHACLELGYIYEERNEEYGFDFKKKTNNNRQLSKKIRGVKMAITIDNEHTKKLIGWLVLDVMAAVIIFVSEFLLTATNFTPAQAIAMIAIMAGIWGAVEEWLRDYFKLPTGPTEP